MRFLTLLVLAVTVLAVSLFAQVNPTQVTIARDSYGVPRIFAKTDAEVAYGLTWAHAEDDFKTIQLSYSAYERFAGAAPELRRAAADYVVELLHASELVTEQSATVLSPDYKAVLNGYLQGLNDYPRTRRNP